MGDLADDAESSDATLFSRLYPGLRRFAAACSLAHQDPDDLVQEALARALTRGPLRTLNSPDAYLRTAIRNQIKNELRSRERGGRASRRLGAAATVVDTYPSDLSALAHLTVDERAVLFLVDIESTPRDATARLLGWSRSKTDRRLRSARSTVRAVLEKEMKA